ncbi:uncharacterized protein LOC114527217 [Dendronephthya gigantea]|uniref:uncharacterized protein LOC114527217 n=1 Tax=Dendronephthya gigantea TaxID=151771 RepID=UPI00106CA719|nr:uncharacterized protein LOC114527217 [Dendronephthya gigantea]
MRLLFATFFLSGVLSAPFSNVLNQPAAPVCRSHATHFHTRKSLMYSYEGETITGLVGTSEVRSGLKLKAKCEITPVQPCVYMLQILEAELLEGQGKNQDALDFKLSSGSEDLSRELKARELYFENHEGLILNIRPHSEEPVRILNMKRGILSSFQLKLNVPNDRNLTEVDVNGECTANYHIKARHDSGRTRIVVKQKDLSLCKDRSETNLGIPVTHYSTDKPFSLLKSNSLCKFVMSPKQKIGKVLCEETHLFRPFSAGYNSSSGAMTTVRQSISMLGHSEASKNPSVPETRSSLKYEHVDDPEMTTKRIKDVADILTKLDVEEIVKPDTARLFTKLIFAIRRLNLKGLGFMWSEYYDCLQGGKCTKEQSERNQKYIVEALSQCGTLHCANFMVTTITEGKVGTPVSVQFLTGIALVGMPSEDMVANILFFCEESPSRTAFLTLGTLMNKYCSQHSCDNLDNNNHAIYRAERFLQRRLPPNCQASTQEELQEITLALKAIGNAGRPYTSVDNILKCAVQPGPSFINIDAIQALRRMPCHDEMTSGLANIFSNLTMDTEIRIESYLALMRCHKENDIQRISDILDTEKNNQVGSFVYSHLTSALKSTEPVYGIPLRDAISKALQGRNLRPFNLDHLRFSHAYAASYYNKKYDVGGSSQAQVIFHPESYFPRSAKLNLTVDMLGASVNLLETSARFEGFETLIERMFGPEGYFPDDRLMQMLMMKPTEAISRDKRSATEDEMNEIKANLEQLKDKMKIERKNPTGALSLKVFGHELQFLNFEDIDWLQGEADKINVIETLINIARGGKVTYTKSFMLLEADHEIPTGLGFPLKLAVNSSGVSSVTLKGKLDIRNMFWGKKKFDVRGFVTPSATVDISGKMTVDALHATSGVHVNASLYTSTEINGNATYKEGEGIKFSIEPPSKPMYIVNVKSNLATFLNEKREKISGPPKRFEHKNCLNLTRFLGVNLCGHISLPMAYRDYNSPYFPLSGDASFGMVFHTTNPKLARFEVETRRLTSEDENRFDWIFNVHVPGLTFGRKVVGNSSFQILPDGKYLSVSGGIQDYKFGKFEAKYNNETNRLHTKFTTPKMAFLRPITVETEIFNTKNNDTKIQDIGISINASYNNFTITDVLSFHKHKDRYGVKSKLTYWPEKHITTEAQFSLEKRSLFMKMDDSGSTSRLFFAGKFGDDRSSFYAKVGNDLMNKELKIDGKLNAKNQKLLMTIVTKPSWNVVQFEAYPRSNLLENGYHMRLSHFNSSSYLNGYLGSLKLKNEYTLKFNGVFMKRPFLFRTSYHRSTSGRRLEWVAQGFGNVANASIEYSKNIWSNSNLEFSGALNNNTIKAGMFLKEAGIGMYLNRNTIEMEAHYKNEENDKQVGILLHTYNETQIKKRALVRLEYATKDQETSVAFKLDGWESACHLVFSHYRQSNENGLKMNAHYWNGLLVRRVLMQTGIFRNNDEKGLRVYANILNRELEAKWSILSGDVSGVKFAALLMKKELSLQSTWAANSLLKELRVDATYNKKTYSLVYTYKPQDKYLCSAIVGLPVGRLETCVQLVNNIQERSLRFVLEGFEKTFEMKTGWTNSTESKGAILQMSYNRVQISDFFAGIVTLPSYTGLRLKGTVKEKTVEALLKYKHQTSARSVSLDLSVQGKLVTFESMLVREQTLQGVQMNMIYQTKRIGQLFALLHKKSSNHELFKIGGKAMNYGAEYHLSLLKSKLERKLSSMVVITARSTHYKYGYSVSHSNMGTNDQPNHILTFKLHYAKDKFLTSTYQFVNTDQNFNLVSKMELAPGQFLTNKIVYHKTNRKLSIKYELLPGIGMTYNAAFINNDQITSVQSNLTIMDYPIDGSALYSKQNGLFTLKMTYGSDRPLIEFTSHLRRQNGIDFGYTLMALNRIWNNTFVMDYPSKQLQLSYDILPNIPIKIFGKMFENKQFVLNMTTSSAFSIELTGTALNKDEYQLVLKHEFMGTMYEDLDLLVSSLQHLNKLRLQWESKAGRDLLKNMNGTMDRLLNKTLARLSTLGELARELVNYTVNFLRNDGRDKLLTLVNKVKKEILFLKDHLRTLEMNTIKTYSARAAHLLKKLKEDVLAQLAHDMKLQGSQIIDTYKYILQSIEDISFELSPSTKLFTADLRKWLLRTVHRYLNVSICGVTTVEMIDLTREKTHLYYTMVRNNIQRYLELGMMECRKLSTVFERIENVTRIVKETVEEFTCNYTLECTKRNVQERLKKLAGKISLYDIKHVLTDERLNKIVERMTLAYKEIENYLSKTIKDQRLRERAMRVLQPVLDLLKTTTLAIKMKIEHIANINKLKEQQKELFRTIEKSKEYATNVKTNLFNKVGEASDSLWTKTTLIYHKLRKLLEELDRMSWEDLQVYAKNETEINFEKLKENLRILKRNVTEMVESSLERHSDIVDLVKKFGKTIYTVANDIMNGSLTVQDAQEKLELLSMRLMNYLKEQKLQAMNKIKKLKLDETARKTYKSAVELYRSTMNQLKNNMTLLYPKMTSELKNVLLKIKGIIVRFVKLAKTKLVDLCEKRSIYLKKVKDNLLEKKEILMTKVYELLKNKDFDISYLKYLAEEIVKMEERFQNKLKQAISEYRTKLATTVENVKMEINNTFILYRNMTFEDIYLKLQVKAGEIFDKLSGFIIGETLFSYKRVMEIKELYQRNKRMVETKWLEFKAVIQNLRRKFGAFKMETIRKISMYYLEKNLPYALLDYFNVSQAKFEQMKLWYEHVKYIKFRDFYRNVMDYLLKYEFNVTKCCEKKIKALVREIKEMKVKLNGFIAEVKNESRNIIQRIKQVNKDVKQDAIETFTPYEKLLRNVFGKHMNKTLTKLEPFTEKYGKMLKTLLTEYKNTTEMFMKQCVQYIRTNLDRYEILDMVNASLQRYPFLMKSKQFLTRSLKNYSLSVNECLEFVRKDLLKYIVESLNKFPLFYQVRTHKLWPALQQEILNHELIVGIQELRKTSEKMLKELPTYYYTHSLSKLRELRDKTFVGLERLRNDLLAKNEEMKKAIMEKREEIHETLRVGHSKLRSHGERLVEKTRDLYKSKHMKLQETLERIGEMSIHDIETRIRQYLNTIFVPMKTAYTDLSELVVAELLVLDKRYREMLEQVNKLRNRYEHVTTDVNEYGMRAWTWSQNEFGKLKNLSLNGLEKLETCTNKCMVVVRRFIVEYVPYKEFVKMTPNQLIERLRSIPVEAKKLYNSTRTITVRWMQLSLRMLTELKNNVDPEQIQIMKEKAERLLNNTRDQMHFLATEIMETTVFMTKFYGSGDTVYNARPAIVQFASYQLRRFINCTRICKVRAMKLYNESRDIIEGIFTRANYTYRKRFPQLVKFITELGETKHLQKLQIVAKKYLNISEEFVEDAKRLVQNRYGTILVYLRNLKAQYETNVTKYTEIVYKLPVLVKNALGKLPLILDMIKRDLKTLINDAVSKLDEGKLYLQDEVFLKVTQTYIENVNTLKRHFIQMKNETSDVLAAIRENIKEELPFIKNTILNITKIIRETKISVVSGKLELTPPRLDELRENFSDLNTMLLKKITE